MRTRANKIREINNMKRPARFTQSRALVATVAALGSVAAFAQQVNPTDVVLQRLKQTAAKETSDGYKLTAVKLKGDINTDGIKFTLPTVVPEKPLVLLQQRIANCNDREVLGRSTVNKSTENSESFSKSSTLGGETSVSVSYESPIGLGGSASQSFNYSSTTTEEKTFTALVGAVGVDAIEQVLLYHVVPGAAITKKAAVNANGAELTTAQGGTIKVRVYNRYLPIVELRDKDTNDVNPFLNPRALDLNAGNAQIAHGIVFVLRPLDL